MKRLVFILSLLSISSFGQFTNVLISDQFSPNEPAIVIDPNNTNHIFAAANLNNYYISNDGGLTWSENLLTSPSYGVWGDFSLLIDNNSNLYTFHLSNPPGGSWIDRIVCQKSTDNGITFNDGTFFGLNGSKDQDKEWITIDRNNGNIYVFWTEFDAYGSSASNCETRIMFTRSEDSGDTWSTPFKINDVNGNCEDVDLTVEGAVPTIGLNGEIFVSWAGPEGIVFNRSTDFGVTWLNQDIFVDAMPNGWDYSIPGIDRANGFPITACDISGGENNGTIYINWSDQRNGTNDTDIWLKKSIDNGDTWSAPVRVNDDAAGNQQFFTWMDIDQTNGYIYIVFYDRRNHTDNNTDVYLARSIDGGNTFQNIKISESPFLPNASVFFGDYTNISVHNGIIRPIWARLHQGNLSVWTAIIHDDDILGSNQFTSEAIVFENYPNPATAENYISFKLKDTHTVNLKIYNILGEEIAVIINDKKYNYGKHVLKINLKEFNLKQGVYFYKLKIGNVIKTKKMIVE